MFLQNRLFYTLSLLVLILYSPKKALYFSFKVTMFLHYLWVGPLQAIAVTALLWMEIGMSCLAGMAVLMRPCRVCLCVCLDRGACCPPEHGSYIHLLAPPLVFGADPEFRLLMADLNAYPGL